MKGEWCRISKASVLIALAACPVVAAAQSAEPKASTRANGPVFAVASIDVLPQKKDQGEGIIRAYVAKAKADKQVLRIWFLDELSTPNHFEVIELLPDRSAHDAHVAQPYVIDFRNKLHDVIGSPYDERLFSDASR